MSNFPTILYSKPNRGNKELNQPFRNADYQRKHLQFMLEEFTKMKIIQKKNCKWRNG